ncbi:MAG: fimbrial assembly family protein [Gammaproteobacteria bacterium]|nr:fimbrial assembly family protein [Gammaproteobacteria bacterium]
MRPAIQLDFAGGRRGLSLAGALLLGLGIVAAVGVLLEYRIIGQRRAGLELRLTAITRATALAAGPVDAADARVAVSAQQAAVDLATPWTLLLSELEQASKDSEGQVALLGVEPDHAKHSVRVSAEARTLALALAYVQRLQASRSLTYPMLDRHEIRADDAQHPVRFELSGAWRDTP